MEGIWVKSNGISQVLNSSRIALKVAVHLQDVTEHVYMTPIYNGITVIQLFNLKITLNGTKFVFPEHALYKRIENYFVKLMSLNITDVSICVRPRHHLPGLLPQISPRDS